jgi:formate/nitrite transporter FocA (FNT family)
MESFAVTLIFILGGLTFLVNWAFLILRGTEIHQEESLVDKCTKLLVYFLLSSLGVLVGGVLFVSVFMFAHG